MKRIFSALFFVLVVVFISFGFSQKQNSKETGFEKKDIIYSSEPTVRVRFLNTRRSVNFHFIGDWVLSDYSSKTELAFTVGSEITFTVSEGKIRGESGAVILADSLKLESKVSSAQLEVKDVPYGVGWWWEGKETRTYEGDIFLYVNEEQNLEVVVQLPLEKYLCGVVPYEIGGDSPIEALKAQAVAARSEAVIALNSNLYRGVHHDLTSDVECQVFAGNNRRSVNSDRAVKETRGIILSENGNPINAYYASNCGGASELIKNVWPDRPEMESYKLSLTDSDEHTQMDLSSDDKAREWIFSEPEVFCNPNLNIELPQWSKNNFRWQRMFSIDSLSHMISREQTLGQLLEIKTLKRGSSGRVYSAKFIFEQGSFEVNGELNIRQMFNPPLRSACFVFDKTEDKSIITGAGWGHGIGMCQSGTIAQAIAGKKFNSILLHYYSKAELISMY